MRHTRQAKPLLNLVHQPHCGRNDVLVTTPFEFNVLEYRCHKLLRSKSPLATRLHGSSKRHRVIMWCAQLKVTDKEVTRDWADARNYQGVFVQENVARRIKRLHQPVVLCQDALDRHIQKPACRLVHQLSKSTIAILCNVDAFTADSKRFSASTNLCTACAVTDVKKDVTP